jgi:hypothetical protein
VLYYLHCLLPRLEAEEELRARRTQGQLSPERLYHLVLVTTGDEKLAAQAQADFLLEIMKQRPADRSP